MTEIAQAGAENNGSQSTTQPKKKKKHPVRITILTLLGLVLVAAIVAGVSVWGLLNSFDTKTAKIPNAFPAETNRPLPANNNSMNILLLGSDTSQANTDGSVAAGRSDTMMLIHIPADRQNVYVTSIMRDTWVNIPGQGQAKINAAMAFGGVPLTVQTVEGLFNTRIDHVGIVDFEGFKALTTALGGVQVNNPVAFSSSGSAGEAFAQGTITLEGESALKFVRERKAFPSGDYQRVQNQQNFLKGVMNKLISSSTLTNPLKVNDIVNQFSPYLTVDKEFTGATMAALGWELRNVRSNNIVMFTLPTNGTGTSADGQSIVLPDEQAIAALAQALQNDTVGAYVDSINKGS